MNFFSVRVPAARLLPFFLLTICSLLGVYGGQVQADPHSNERIDLNRATYKQLLTLPSIGPARARKIIAMRAKLKSGFTSVQQLQIIRGIGKRTVEKLASRLFVKKGRMSRRQVAEEEKVIERRHRVVRKKMQKRQVGEPRRCPSCYLRWAKRGKELRVKINSASAYKLRKLPCIGARSAKKIVQERKRKGSFSSESQLAQIKGIRVRIWACIAKHIDFQSVGEKGIQAVQSKPRQKEFHSKSKIIIID